MKLVLVNQRYRHSRTIVIKGWLKGLLSLCLLGAPVALGLGYQLALAEENSRRVVSHEQGVQNVATPANAKALSWVDSTDILNSPSRGAVDIMRSLPIAGWQYEIADWQYEVVAPYAVIGPHTLASVAQLAELRSSKPPRGTFAHGRIIDPASYLRRTHR